MFLEQFDYHLPLDLVAQQPAAARDGSRLMLLDRQAGAFDETGFDRFPDQLKAGDLLVLNDSRVVPARLLARKPTGGLVEILLVERDAADAEGRTWVCLASTGRGLRPGSRLSVAAGFEAEFAGEAPGGRLRFRLHADGGDLDAAIRRHGVMPLPPYIRRSPGDPRADLDRERYQTVYARDEGSIAAPTAGLHFTPALLERIAAAGVEVTRLTLHVGPGTFQPVRAPRVEEHRIEPEFCRLPSPAARAVAGCRARGGRVVAVGTTATRALEWRARDDGTVEPGEGRCDLVIVQGHRFKVVDALLTNFHLPRSSLLMLVCAFAGREAVLRAYHEAVAAGYRFYSYGDAMLIV
jgi:S-adenosylmethionine:tRNA ribosyltransferase-isomerase